MNTRRIRLRGEAEKTGEEGSDLEEEDDDDPFLDDYQEQMAELDAEEPPEEEEMEDEGEEEFEERTMTALREKYEEQTDTISSVQVRAISQFLKFIQAFFMNKSTTCTCTCVYSSQSTCRACFCACNQ